MEWVYKDEKFNPYDIDSFGFIYRITYEDSNGLQYTYYGRKEFYSYVTMKARLDEVPRANHYKFFNKNLNGKRTKMEMIRNESNWRKYNGSAKYIPEELKIVSKEILKICESKIDLTYYECYHLMVNEVLFDKYNLNYNVMGKFYAEQISGSKEYKKG